MAVTDLLIVAGAGFGGLGYYFLARLGVRGRFQALYMAVVVFLLTLGIPILEGERLGPLSVCLAVGGALVGYGGLWLGWSGLADSLRRYGYRDDW